MGGMAHDSPWRDKSPAPRTAGGVLPWWPVGRVMTGDKVGKHQFQTNASFELDRSRPLSRPSQPLWQRIAIATLTIPTLPCFWTFPFLISGMCLDVFGCPCCMGTRVEAHHWHSGINLVRFKDTLLFIVEKSHLGKFKQDQFADVFQSCRCLSKLQMSFQVSDIFGHRSWKFADAQRPLSKSFARCTVKFNFLSNAHCNKIAIKHDYHNTFMIVIMSWWQ